MTESKYSNFDYELSVKILHLLKVSCCSRSDGFSEFSEFPSTLFILKLESIKIEPLFQGSYPAKLKKVLIVAAPLWFKAPFKVLQLFVREKLRDRIYTGELAEE